MTPSWIDESSLTDSLASRSCAGGPGSTCSHAGCIRYQAFGIKMRISGPRGYSHCHRAIQRGEENEIDSVWLRFPLVRLGTKRRPHAHRAVAAASGEMAPVRAECHVVDIRYIMQGQQAGARYNIGYRYARGSTNGKPPSVRTEGNGRNGSISELPYSPRFFPGVCIPHRGYPGLGADGKPRIVW